MKTTRLNLILRALAALYGTAVVAACAGEAGATARWTAVIDTIGDTVVVRTVSGQVWQTDAELVPEISIGVLDGEDAYMLGNVTALAVSPAGDIYALDRQVPVLRKYSADGVHITDLGRSGSGPGEYSRPGGLTVLSDGRVLLRDPGNARFNVYGDDGTAIGEWPLPGGGTFGTDRRLYVDAADNSYTLVLLERGVPITQWRYGLARVDTNGQHSDTLIVPTWNYQPQVVTAQNEIGSSSYSVPYTAQRIWTYSPLGYFVGGVSSSYRIDLLRTDGMITRIESTLDPVPVDPADKSESEERIASNIREQFPGWRWNGPRVPDTKPPFRNVFAGLDGRIWVQLSQPSQEILSVEAATAEEQRTGNRPGRFSEPAAFDVFEQDGSYLGKVDVPQAFTTSPEPVFRGDYVWAVARDSLDVASVVRYRIQPRIR
jgi:hypothetical protein